MKTKMGIKPIKTKDGIKLKDTKTGKLAGGVSTKGKKAPKESKIAKKSKPANPLEDFLRKSPHLVPSHPAYSGVNLSSDPSIFADQIARMPIKMLPFGLPTATHKLPDGVRVGNALSSYRILYEAELNGIKQAYSNERERIRLIEKAGVPDALSEKWNLDGADEEFMLTLSPKDFQVFAQAKAVADFAINQLEKEYKRALKESDEALKEYCRVTVKNNPKGFLTIYSVYAGDTCITCAKTIVDYCKDCDPDA